MKIIYALYLYVSFVNISAYIPTEIPTRLSNIFYAKSFIFTVFNVSADVEYAIYSGLVICNNFIYCKELPVFDFHSLGLESSQ